MTGLVEVVVDCDWAARGSGGVSGLVVVVVNCDWTSRVESRVVDCDGAGGRQVR